jgi:DNA-binding MarR family transcriptional regulator
MRKRLLKIRIYMYLMRSKQPLPEASLEIMEFLRSTGSKTQREIIDELKLPVRTVRYSIRRLLEKSYLTKQPNLHDMRSVYYAVNPHINNLDFEEVKRKEFAHV